MDDFNVSSLHESKNEWGARLLTILTPLVIEGFKSIFDESVKLCKVNEEMGKYLMTFQNFLNNIPKWSSEIVENEKQRIITSSACNYLEDLISCVHITQLKSLTSSRVGLKQKKIKSKLTTNLFHSVRNSTQLAYDNKHMFLRKRNSRTKFRGSKKKYV